MDTQTIATIVAKKDFVSEAINKAYDLAINHAIETVRNFIINPELSEPIIERLETLKSK